MILFNWLNKLLEPTSLRENPLKPFMFACFQLRVRDRAQNRGKSCIYFITYKTWQKQSQIPQLFQFI